MSPAAITIALLIFAAVMFVTEIIPLSITAMTVAILLNLTGVLDAKQIFSGFIDNNVVLFCAMFIVGGALFETGMAKRIGGLVTRFAKTERQLIFAVMLVVGGLSSVLSNTGTAAVLMPVVIGIAAKSGFSRSKLLMPLVYAAAMGGNITLIGAPGNMIADSGLRQINQELGFGFFEFAKIGIPILAVGIIYYVFIGYRLLPDRVSTLEYVDKSDVENVPVWKQYMSLVILAASVLAMIFEKKIGISLHIIGTIGALLLIITRVMTESQAFHSIDLRTIFLFGGTLPLALAMDKTGAGKMLADWAIGLMGDNPSPMALLIVIFVLAGTLTQFMSNTATTALLVPIGLSIANNLGADPRAVMMATVIGGSVAFATPIGMPANTMVYGPGGFKFLDYTRAGLPLVIIAMIVSVILLPIFWPFFPGK